MICNFSQPKSSTDKDEKFPSHIGDFRPIFFVRTSGKMDSFLCKYQYLKYQITFFSCPRCVNVIIYVGIHSFFHKKYFKKHRGSKSAKIKNKLRTISASESIAQGKI